MSSSFHITIDGNKIKARSGQTLAAVMLANGHTTCQHSAKNGQPRGLYCGMGICWECTMVVDGQQNVRSCVTLVTPDMKVEIQNKPSV